MVHMPAAALGKSAVLFAALAVTYTKSTSLVNRNVSRTKKNMMIGILLMP